MTDVEIRKGMPPRELDADTFKRRYLSQFRDPVFGPLRAELKAIAAAAWNAYSDGRKAPVTRRAGPGFADPDYEVAVDWLEAHEADPSSPSSILLINGSTRTEHTCPGEMSKSWRLVELALRVFEVAEDVATDYWT
jgi:hypothetical protein